MMQIKLMPWRRGRHLFLVVVILGLHATAFGAPRIYRDRVDPHWFAGDTRFWYRVDTGQDTHEFIAVDAERGTRSPAFDHAKVAAALTKALGRDVSPKRLPIDDLEFEQTPNALVLIGSGKEWRLDLHTYELRQDRDSHFLPAIGTPHPSGEGGAATEITFANHAGQAVEVYWLDFDGNRRHYASIEPAGQWTARTFDGHVWLVTDTKDGKLGVFEATSRSTTAVIEARAASDRNDQRLRRQRSEESRDGPRSPDGKWIAINRDDKLFLRPSDGGSEIELSKDGRPGDDYSADRVWWAPDSRNLVAMRTEAGEEHQIYEVESSPTGQLQPKLRTLNYPKPGDRIDHPRPQLFHVPSGEHIALDERLFDNPWSIQEVRWSEDSSRFTFVYNARGHQTLRVVAVDAAKGDTRALVEETSGTFIDYSGKYFCQWVGDNQLIWMSERDGWNHLWLYDSHAGAVKTQITRGQWVVQRVMYVDSEARQIWFMAGGIRLGQDPYYAHFCRVNFDGTGLTVLTEGDGDHRIQWSPGDKYFIDTWSRVDQPPVIELRSSESGKLVCELERADASEILADRCRWPERFVARGRDGTTDIYGILIYPRPFEPAKKYPVVEQIYAGPQGFYTPKAFRAGYGSAQAIADRGVIVVQCDGMGTSGRSKKFHDVCWKNLRDAGFPDRIAWMKAAAATHPQMDLTRVGVYGGSAGGQNAMAAMLWHNEFYKVAVADCGCHDNRMDKIWWNEQWMGWPIGPEYAENSNAVNAHLLRGKLMLVVGELDDNVDPASTMQVVNALEKANKDFELVIVTGAHHGAAETPYGSRRRSDFLIENLVGPSVSTQSSN
jgi:dipeptidyl-peptidase-4